MGGLWPLTAGTRPSGMRLLSLHSPHFTRSAVTASPSDSRKPDIVRRSESTLSLCWPAPPNLRAAGRHRLSQWCMRPALQEWQVSLDNDVVLRGVPPARWIAFRLTALRWSQEGAVGAEDDVAPSVPVPPRIFEPPKRCANRLAARRPPPAAPLALNDALPGPGRGGWV